METNEMTEASLGSKAKSSTSLIGGAAVLGVSSITAIIAGVITARRARKRSRELLRDLGREPVPPVALESPYALAFRALAWGTVWAVGGCSLILFGIWKWYGFKDLEDVRTRARGYIKKSSNSDERTEFESLSDFLNYLNETSKTQTKAQDSKTS